MAKIDRARETASIADLIVHIGASSEAREVFWLEKVFRAVKPSCDLLARGRDPGNEYSVGVEAERMNVLPNLRRTAGANPGVLVGRVARTVNRVSRVSQGTPLRSAWRRTGGDAL